MLHCSFSPYVLDFKSPSWTSRGVLTHKEMYIVRLMDADQPDKAALGECALFRGLSADDVPDYEKVLADLCWNINDYKDTYQEKFKRYPSIVFGLETAFADLVNGCRMRPFPSDFTQGKGHIKINGLIWVGPKEQMVAQVRSKIDAGFGCIKLKVGAHDFEEEVEMLRAIRSEFSRSDIELRVDANGAFKEEEALKKLEVLSKLDLHSIEQPIKAGNWAAMAKLCKETPLPIALDEELIGVFEKEEKARLLQEIKPQYIVLKPSLHGAFCGTDEWISLAEEQQIGWWITSALESNIGLNAIAQWTYRRGVSMPQGLGTGQLYLNNLPSFLQLEGDRLSFDVNRKITFE
ncbi:MAG: o-succinylbenzoate synthase [Paludibacteraceae bacterium]|nr:o-succinylbenzoate synthase [Paludibacteraceae bacterium]